MGTVVLKSTRVFTLVGLLLLLTGCGVNDFYDRHFGGVVKADEKISLSAALTKARKLEKAGDFKGADQTYRTALNQHGNNTKLKQRYRNFQARHQDRMARLEVNALIRKANALKRKHYQRKAKDAGYRGEHWQEAVLVSKQLAGKGLAAMKDKRMNLAERALEMSVRVHSNHTTRSAYQQFAEHKERREFAELVRKGRKMADVSIEPRL